MRVLSLSQVERQREELRKIISGLETVTEVLSYDGTLNGTPVLPVKGDVDLLILDAIADPVNTLDHLERLLPLYPRLNTVLVAPHNSSDLLLRALRMGVREVLRPPVSRPEMAGAIARIEQRQRSAGVSQGEVLAFISCKGGAGATFLATNLGYSLAALEQKKVLLIDLNLQFGDAALFVSDRRPAATLSDVVHDIDRLDSALVQSSVVEVLPNFGVLAAPEDPTLATEIRPEHIESLIRFARTLADIVILDVGRFQLLTYE